MVYIVTEDTDDYTRNAYRNLRPFVLRVTDCLGREIMTMQRPFRCTCCCFCCSCARQEVREQERNRHLLPDLPFTMWSVFSFLNYMGWKFLTLPFRIKLKLSSGEEEAELFHRTETHTFPFSSQVRGEDQVQLKAVLWITAFWSIRYLQGFPVVIWYVMVPTYFLVCCYNFL